MAICARTNYLKPKAFQTSLTTTSEVEPRLFYKLLIILTGRKLCNLNMIPSCEMTHGLFVSCPTNVNIIGCKWIFRIKRCYDGSIEHYKAWLLDPGFSQETNADYFDIFNPVIKPTTTWIALSIAFSHDWSIRQLVAFINKDLKEVMYMKQPHGFEDPTRPHHVCRLNLIPPYLSTFTQDPSFTYLCMSMMWVTCTNAAQIERFI